MAMKYMFNKDVGLKPYNVPELLNELQNLDRVLSGEPIKRNQVKASPVKPVASPVKPVTKTIKVKRIDVQRELAIKKQAIVNQNH